MIQNLIFYIKRFNILYKEIELLYAKKLNVLYKEIKCFK